MADASREKKLAAARKKLKQFQQQQKSPINGNSHSQKSPLTAVKPMRNIDNIQNDVETRQVEHQHHHHGNEWVGKRRRDRVVSPSIDDMSTWPDYHSQMNSAPTAHQNADVESSTPFENNVVDGGVGDVGRVGSPTSSTGDTMSVVASSQGDHGSADGNYGSADGNYGSTDGNHGVTGDSHGSQGSRSPETVIDLNEPALDLVNDVGDSDYHDVFQNALHSPVQTSHISSAPITNEHSHHVMHEDVGQQTVNLPNQIPGDYHSSYSTPTLTSNVVNAVMSNDVTDASATPNRAVFFAANDVSDDVHVASSHGHVTAPTNSTLVQRSSPVQTNHNVDTTFHHPQRTTTASTEGLQQLSRKINGLISESAGYLNGDISLSSADDLQQLENRNRELAAALEKHNQANQQLQFTCQELKGHNANLQEQLVSERDQFDGRLRKEIGSIKEQLQVHIQTIGILVAEKSELQSSLAQSQKQAEKRLQEVEELSGRLKASRTRVSDVERHLATTSSSYQQYEKSSKEFSKEVDRLKLEVYKLTKSLDELKQQKSELQEKLQVKVAECSDYQQVLSDVKHSLEMKDVLIQQLSNQPNDVHAQALEILQQERVELINRIEQYNEAFHQLTSERDQITDQYQQYIDQLTARITALEAQVTSLTDEREELSINISQTEELNKSLRQQIESAEPAANAELEAQVSELRHRLGTMTAEYNSLYQTHEQQISDNSQLSRMVDERELRITELETSLERLTEDGVDRAQLLETMHNDKTSLSRAIAQNKELKAQLAELQTCFVKMSNENMNLMSQFQSEQHISKELGSRLGHQETELREVRDELHGKENDLRRLRQAMAAQHSPRHHGTTSDADDFRDKLLLYDSQADLVRRLEKELNSAQDTINAMTRQNTELRADITSAVSRQERESSGSDTESELGQERLRMQMSAVSASCQQLELERNQLMEQLTSTSQLKDALMEKVELLVREKDESTPALLNGTLVTKSQYETLEQAMHLVEERYTKLTREKAALMDENDRLEHMVIQLQGETDTIGEYITIYHHQRALLAEREFQKEQHIAQLAQDREELQGKLSQLQVLMLQLIQERQRSRPSTDNLDGSYTQQAVHQNHVPNHTGTVLDRRLAQKKQQHNHHHHHNKNDWPDYTSESSDTDSEQSVVEAITFSSAASPEYNDGGDSATNERRTGAKRDDTTPEREWTLPSDPTAQKILHLITDIGQTSRSPSQGLNITPCKCCTGKLHIV